MYALDGQVLDALSCRSISVPVRLGRADKVQQKAGQSDCMFGRGEHGSLAPWDKGCLVNQWQLHEGVMFVLTVGPVDSDEAKADKPERADSNVSICVVPHRAF